MRHFLLALFATPLFAAQPNTAPCCGVLKANRPCADIGCHAKQSDLYVQASFLYWQCLERGLDYAYTNAHPQSDSRITVHSIDPDWQPAFRASIGGHLPHDNWKLDFTYTLFYDSKTRSTYGSIDSFGEGILSPWTSPNVFGGDNLFVRFKYAHSKWKIRSNFFDLMMRTSLFNGTELTFDPAFGIKAAILQQRIALSYTGGNTISPTTMTTETMLFSDIDMNNRSFNFGPSVACALNWQLHSHVELCGSLGSALLASHFSLGRRESEAATLSDLAGNATYAYRFSDSFWTFRPQSSLSLGLRFSDCGCLPCKMLYYGVTLSYEAQVWWKQNMLLKYLTSGQGALVTQAQDNLFFHGLTADIFFDF